MMFIEERIREFAREKNILTGICDAEKLTHLQDTDIKNVPFTYENAESRLNPKIIMPHAKSIIVFGVGYEFDINMPVYDSAVYGKFAVGVLGTDYHIRVKNVMRELADYLSSYVSFDYMLLADNHSLIEREFAKKAGIGWQGKNCMLISEKFGSYFNIGLMLTDMQLEPDRGYAPDYSLCGGCDMCVKSCIGGCLKPYHIDYKKCVSYLTQKKEPLTELEKRSLNGYIYGCDVCQKVCRFNAGFPAESSLIPVDSIINATNKQVKEHYGSAAWRGKKILSRNAEYLFLGGEV